jgi:hypothetical protein
MSNLTLWTMDKTVLLTGQRRHLHKGAPVAPGFTAPSLVSQIQFGPTALAASIARTATLRAASPEAIARLASSVLSDAEMLIAEGTGFALSPLLATFVDIEQTHFAGRVGAGITDLYMNALGYSWRDNAASLSSSLKPHGDFLYDGGNGSGHGVVLAEARGSFAAKVSDAAMARAAEEKYLRQVRPYIGKTSMHGQVIHGYALAFGSRPATGDTFLRLSQTRRPTSTPAPSPFPEPGTVNVPASLAMAAYRSNFILMHALPVADWIDWLDGVRDIPEGAEPVHFVRFGYAGQSFLASVNSLLPYDPFYWRLDGLPDLAFRHPTRWRHRPGDAPRLDWFVMEERAATAFLDGLSGRILSDERERSGTLELPIGDIAGFSLGDTVTGWRGVREDYDYALFRDGLALLGGPPPRKLTGIRTWHPKSGLT